MNTSLAQPNLGSRCVSTKPVNTRPRQELPEDVAYYLALPSDELFKQAKKVREEHFGQTIQLCAIINARSGNCSMDCAFCAQSSHTRASTQGYPLLDASVLSARITALAQSPVRIGLVTSGAALSSRELEQIFRLLDKLPKEILPRLCTSFGRLSHESLEELFKHGIRRYHHNLETAEHFYPHICTTQRWQDRAKTVHCAQDVGFVCCTGGIFGLGETMEDRALLALSLRAQGILHVPMNFLSPQPHTPLANQPLLSANEALRTIALFRLLLPNATLRICGGRPLILHTEEDKIFACGANALMVGDYLTTKGPGLAHDLALIKRLGLEVAHV